MFELLCCFDLLFFFGRRSHFLNFSLGNHSHSLLSAFIHSFIHCMLHSMTLYGQSVRHHEMTIILAQSLLSLHLQGNTNPCCLLVGIIAPCDMMEMLHLSLDIQILI